MRLSFVARLVLTSQVAYFSAAALAQEEPAENPFGNDRGLEQRDTRDGTDYSPYTGDVYPQQLLWGDTHLHSALSIDANNAGNQNLGPADAYRFARGDEVIASSGKPVRLSRPLDFLVVSDHAEYLGLMPRIRKGDPALAAHPTGQKLLTEMAKGPEAAAAAMTDLVMSFIDSEDRYPVNELTFDTWKKSTAIADQYNQPGRFTSLIGYEWTYFPKGDNLHRVVVYKDGADKASSMPPFSSLDGNHPEQLWDFMAGYEEKTGGEIMAIPHNSNVSNGRMFALQDSRGDAFSQSYSKRRQRWEPLVEVTQIKGDSEAHPLLSPDDEFADFENWDKGNLSPIKANPKKPEMLQYEYARSALKLGLEEEQRNSINPFKFGMIGSTDAHTSLATGAEDNFWGKASLIEPGFERLSGPFMPSTPGVPEEQAIIAWEMVASGYAAVWATENTREAIFAAMKRKEVYATTGSRLALRMFGSWGFEQSDLDRPDRVSFAYSNGVSMGGDLPSGKADGAPSFMVLAAKDPIGANLDRIQIVKGWLDASGVAQEKVYNVAVSDKRRISRNGKVKALKSTVDLDAMSFSNSIGASELSAVWTDPDFDSKQKAFYYTRVIEIPTPRWTEYDRSRYGFDVPEGAPAEIQDRAYSSPIWYTPK